jgi:hypothetical protein
METIEDPSREFHNVTIPCMRITHMLYTLCACISILIMVTLHCVTI